MELYGAEIVADDPDDAQPDLRPGLPRSSGYLSLFRSPTTGIALALSLSAIGVGLVTYGFQLWLPTNLQEIGFTEVTSSNVLRNSALLGLPLTPIRSRATGLATGASKAGGVLIIALVVASLATPSIAVTALAGAIPLAAAAAIVMLTGVETRGRRLEMIMSTDRV
jgi:putative MFS transporter